VIYTTNLIESINARLRKVTRNRGQFPSEQAVLNVLYLAVRNLEEFRRPNVGIRASGWKQAPQAFTIYFQGRSPPHDRHHHLHRQSDAPGRGSSGVRCCRRQGLGAVSAPVLTRYSATSYSLMLVFWLATTSSRNASWASILYRSMRMPLA
jgi:hypothetical protein